MKHLRFTISFIAVLLGAATQCPAALVGQWTFENGSLADSTGNFGPVVIEGNATVSGGALDINGSGTTSTGWAHAPALPASSPIQNKTLVSWITLQGLNNVAQHGAAISIDLQSGDRFDGIVFGERDANRWMNGSSGFQRTPPGQFDQVAVSVETVAPSPSIIKLAVSYEGLGGGNVRITGYRNGILMGTYDIGNFVTWSAGEYEILFGPRHSNPGPNGALDALVHEARLYNTALTQAEIQALELFVSADTDNDGLVDQWELTYAPNLTGLNGLGTGPGPGAGTGDFDGDGLLDLNEQTRTTNPVNPDTDGDTLTDGAEVAGAGARPPTSPTNTDSDGDGLTDLIETNDGSLSSPTDTGTNPAVADTDTDGYNDGFEIRVTKTDPLTATVLSFSQSLFGHWTFEPGSELKDLTGNFPDVILEGDAVVADGALNINGSGTTSSGWAHSGAGGGAAIGNKTLVSWITLEGLEDVAKSGAPMSLDSAVTDKFDGIVFAERDANRWMNGSSFFNRTPPGQFDRPRSPWRRHRPRQESKSCWRSPMKTSAAEMCRSPDTATASRWALTAPEVSPPGRPVNRRCCLVPAIRARLPMARWMPWFTKPASTAKRARLRIFWRSTTQDRLEVNRWSLPISFTTLPPALLTSHGYRNQEKPTGWSGPMIFRFGSRTPIPIRPAEPPEREPPIDTRASRPMTGGGSSRPRKSDLPFARLTELS